LLGLHLDQNRKVLIFRNVAKRTLSVTVFENGVGYRGLNKHHGVHETPPPQNKELVAPLLSSKQFVDYAVSEIDAP